MNTQNSFANDKNGQEQGQNFNAPRKTDLDPSFLEGCASLLELVDKKVVVLLRDNKTLIGILRSLDQFNNLVLQDTVERITVDKMYADVPRGLYIIRGDTVMLVGEVDDELAKKTPMVEVSMDIILAAQREKDDAKKVKEAKRESAFKNRGMAYAKDSGMDDC